MSERWEESRIKRKRRYLQVETEYRSRPPVVGNWKPASERRRQKETKVEHASESTNAAELQPTVVWDTSLSAALAN
jgi:hypothetical protein